MTLEPIELHNIHTAEDNSYARIRVGKLKAILDYQRSLEDDVERLESSLLGSRDVCDAYKKKYNEAKETTNEYDKALYLSEARAKEAKEMELIQRRRANDAENKLVMYENIKLDIKG